MDKGGSVSPNVRLHVPSISVPAARSGAAAPDPDLQVAAEANGIQPEQTPAPSDIVKKSDPVAGIKNNY